jgi:hypothetical protein
MTFRPRAVVCGVIVLLGCLDLTLTPQRDKRFSVSLFCNNLLDKHYAVHRNNVRGNYSFPVPSGTAYTQELPRDFDRYYGIRVAFSGP